MRLTSPSQDYLLATRSSSRTIDLRFYIRGKSDRSSDLTGLWTDITDRVSNSSIPTFSNELELNLSQYSASKISIVGLGLSWWETVIFNYEHFLEVKVDFILNGLVLEPVTIFSGWVEKKKDRFKYKRSELYNRVSFDVWSYPDYADEIHASSVLTQYLDPDIDGAESSGLVLPKIKNLYVTDANIASYVLKKGVHTIRLRLDGVDKSAQLDDGEWTVLSTGLNTLSNADGDQKVEVYAKANLPTDDLEEEIVVDSPGDTFPKNWWTAVSAEHMLRIFFAKAGIESVSFDSMEYPTADGSKKISFLDLVPGDAGVTLSRTAVVSDGSHLWFGVGNRLYRRDLSSVPYELLQTLNAGDVIQRIMFNERNDHLWLFIVASDASTKIRKYTISTDTLSDEVDIENSHHNAIAIVDYKDENDVWYYSLVYASSDGGIYEVNPTTLSVSPIIDPASSLSNVPALFMKDERTVYYTREGDMYKIERDTTEYLWNYDDGESGTYLYTISGGKNYNASAFAFDVAEAKVYFYSFISPAGLFSHPIGSGTATHVTDVLAREIYYSPAVERTFMSGETEGLYELHANTATQRHEWIFTKYHALTDHNGRIYGMDVDGRLFQYADKIALFIPQAKLAGMSVRGAIEKACSSFNLVYKISSTKKARVQRRSDENGDVVSAGNPVVIDGDNLKDISDESFYGDAYDIVKVSNGTREVNYDGSDYDAVAFDAEKVHTIDSDWIPSEILEDLAFNAFKFFSVFHKVYLAPTAGSLLHQETLDGATINYSGNMSVNKDGVIISDGVDANGRATFKILLNN